MKSFYEHLSSRHEFGEKIDYSKRPILRSSGIFPVIKNKYYTSEILFLGYWVIKRNIPEVSLLLTLRDQNGLILKREFITVEEPKAYTISLDSMLREISLTDDATFLGSIEVEIFSTRDMVFPYPALVLNYFNREFNTCVHTLGRVYNDIEDLQENQKFIVPETGFDIYSDRELESFMSFVNGPIQNDNSLINYVVINAESKKFSGSFLIEKIKPYQTILLKFNDHIPNLAKFLNGKPGSITINHNFEGFFPRFLVGNMQHSFESMSFTHSYYDCTSCSNPSDYWDRMSEDYYDSTVPLPLFVNDNFFTELIFYPNFSPSNFDIDINIHDEQGNLLLAIPNFMNIDSSNSKLIRINFNDIISNNALNPVEAKTSHLISSFNGKKIPTRLKHGLNVGIKSKKAKLPCNICFNSKVGNPSINDKPGSFHWCPIFPGDSVVSLENFSPLKKYSRKAENLLTFYRAKDTKSIEKEITIPPNGEFRFELRKNPEVQSFLDGENGWLTIRSNNPYVQGYYFNFHSSGSVAGDHLF